MMLAFFAGSVVLTQWQAQSKTNPGRATHAEATDTQKANIQQYKELLESNVQQRKVVDVLS